jgi:hypothetical protein
LLKTLGLTVIQVSVFLLRQRPTVSLKIWRFVAASLGPEGAKSPFSISAKQKRPANWRAVFICHDRAD